VQETCDGVTTIGIGSPMSPDSGNLITLIRARPFSSVKEVIAGLNRDDRVSRDKSVMKEPFTSRRATSGTWSCRWRVWKFLIASFAASTRKCKLLNFPRIARKYYPPVHVTEDSFKPATPPSKQTLQTNGNSI